MVGTTRAVNGLSRATGRCSSLRRLAAAPGDVGEDKRVRFAADDEVRRLSNDVQTNLQLVQPREVHGRVLVCAGCGMTPTRIERSRARLVDIGRQNRPETSQKRVGADFLLAFSMYTYHMLSREGLHCCCLLLHVPLFDGLIPCYTRRRHAQASLDQQTPTHADQFPFLLGQQ